VIILSQLLAESTMQQCLDKSSHDLNVVKTAILINIVPSALPKINI